MEAFNYIATIKDPEAYNFCYKLTLWLELKGFKESWFEYYVGMEYLADRLMSPFAEAQN